MTAGSIVAGHLLGAVLLRAGMAASASPGTSGITMPTGSRNPAHCLGRGSNALQPEVWLPLPFWITGSVLHVWNDLDLAPRLMTCYAASAP